MQAALAVGEGPSESVQADVRSRELGRTDGRDGFPRGIGGRGLVVAELNTRDRVDVLGSGPEAMLRRLPGDAARSPRE